jgi:hypothetical protein
MDSPERLLSSPADDGRVAGVTSYEQLRAAIHDAAGCGPPRLVPGRAMPS